MIDMTTPTHVSGKIKPLEWSYDFASTNFPQSYSLYEDDEGKCTVYTIWRTGDDKLGDKEYHSRALAEAAAQADYEARILASIYPEEGYYITITRSDGIIQGIGTSIEDSENDALLWTDDRDLATYLCTKELYDAVKVYGGDTAFFLSPLGRVFYNGVMT